MPLDEMTFDQQYERIEKKPLGEGTYGEVYKARCAKTSAIVAMKRIKLDAEEEGMPSTALREISLLKELSHENVVKLLDCHCTLQPSKKLYLVFEFVEQDLKRFVKNRGALDAPTTQSFSRQLIEGTEYLHARRILHRDLKPQNLLVTNDKVLKIADFGLARAFHLPIPKYTHEVVTVWYRAPEILLGSVKYSVGVDIWSIGCICAEMATLSPLFPGDSEIDTLFRIFQLLGTPNAEVWKEVKDLPDMKQTFPQWRGKKWEAMPRVNDIFGANGITLLKQLLTYDPKLRLSARRALSHPYFDN